MIKKIYFNISRYFLKVLEMFECRRDDPHMTSNRNFVCFAHSLCCLSVTASRFLLALVSKRLLSKCYALPWFLLPRFCLYLHVLFDIFNLLLVSGAKNEGEVGDNRQSMTPVPRQAGWINWKWFSNWNNWKIFHPKKTYWLFNFLRFVASFYI